MYEIFSDGNCEYFSCKLKLMTYGMALSKALRVDFLPASRAHCTPFVREAEALGFGRLEREKSARGCGAAFHFGGIRAGFNKGTRQATPKLRNEVLNRPLRCPRPTIRFCATSPAKFFARTPSCKTNFILSVARDKLGIPVDTHPT